MMFVTHIPFTIPIIGAMCVCQDIYVVRQMSSCSKQTIVIIITIAEMTMTFILYWRIGSKCVAMPRAQSLFSGNGVLLMGSGFLYVWMLMVPMNMWHIPGLFYPSVTILVVDRAAF